MIRGVPERLGRDLDTIPGVATLPPEPVHKDFCAECDAGECGQCDGFIHAPVTPETPFGIGVCRCRHWEVVG